MELKCECISEDDRNLLLGALSDMVSITRASKDEVEKTAEKFNIPKDSDIYKTMMEWHDNKIRNLNRLHGEIAKIELCKSLD